VLLILLPNRRLTSEQVVRADNFAERVAVWLYPGNHNYLRITRVLTSLREMGLQNEAAAFILALEGMYFDYPNRIGDHTIIFWRQTMEG
jgi:hypothetical protein